MAGPEEPRLKAGLALLRAGRFQSAERIFSGCLDEQGGALAWFYLGAAQHGCGRLQRAEESFAKALSISPGLVQAREARASVLVALNRHAEAEAELRAALASGASHSQLRVNLAIVLEQRGATAEALASYDEVLNSDAGHYAARLNRGALLLSLKRPHEALTDFEQLARTAPDRPEVQLNLARALFELHRDADALTAADHALRLDPHNARAWLDRIIALASLGWLDEAAAALAQARDRSIGLTTVPGGPTRLEQLHPTALYVGRALGRQSVCDWHDRDRLISTLRGCLADPEQLARIMEPGIVFHSLGLPLTSTELAAMANAAARRMRSQSARIDVPAPLAPGSGRNRIKVGFLSATLREHPGARLLRRVFLDRDRASVEYIVFALHPDVHTSVVADIRASADGFVDVTQWSTADIAERIRREGLDLLVDDAGYIEGSRPALLAVRLAPVQATYLGTPSPLGTGIVDYRLNDAFSTPREWQPAWPERLALMNHPAYVFDTDAQAGPPGKREDHELPPEGFVWCCFNQALRIEPHVFDVWMRLLEAVPASVLWLLDGGPLTRTNLRREAERRGIAGERLVFAPRVPLAVHLARHAHADLFLDTLYYNAHTTALDALWGGVPVLTRAGDTMASRVAGSFLNAAGLQELITQTVPEYEAKALELARNPDLLRRLREQVADARRGSPLFDPKAGVRAFERAVRAIVERHRAGLPPDTLIID